MILTFTPNPCVDKTLELNELKLGEKHRDVKRSCVAGGKGNNVARSVRRLGMDAAALVVVAGHTGHHVLDMLENDDEVRGLPFWTGGLTRTITTILETGPHRQTALFEPGPNLGDDEALRLLEFFEGSLTGVQLITLNGAVPCPSLRNVYADMIRIAKTHAIPVLLDAYGEEFTRGLTAAPRIVKLNREEAYTATSIALDSESHYRSALAALQGKGSEIVIITDGPRDIHAAWGNEAYRITPPPVTEVNAVGSGDVFAGALSVALLRGNAPQDCLTFAAAAGAANAQVWDIGHFDTKAIKALQTQAICTAL